MVPLSAIASFAESSTPTSVNHQDGELATTVSYNLAEGSNLADGQAAVHQAEADIGMPTNVRGSFQGTARAAQESNQQQPLLILAAIVVIYIVLGILYESLVHPITVLSTLPSAGVGAVLALLLFKMEFSIIALIGVFLLIGIVKKNAILIIDFALEAERSRGLTPVEAVREACLLRFRPILMTTLAAALGALPLAIGFGEGSELRQPLGIAIIGGLIASQLLTLLTTPVVYILLDKLRTRSPEERALSRVPARRRAYLTMRPTTYANATTSRHRPACLLAIGLLSGCAVGPAYKLPEHAAAGGVQGSRPVDAGGAGRHARARTVVDPVPRPAAERPGRQRRSIEPERRGGGGLVRPGARAGAAAARLAVPDRVADRRRRQVRRRRRRRRRRTSATA